jgi:heme exporter protein A
MQIELENVGRDFGERRVLHAISLTLGAGEVLAVRGHNGSGKSTLLKILAGLIAATEGRVIFSEGGKELEHAVRRSRIGYLAPDLNLYEELTALENLNFFADLRRKPRDGHGALLERVGLSGRGHDLVGTFSTGMKQRLKLAFAIQHRPSVLLLDEPGANLDDAGRALMASVVPEFREGIVVIATNDPADAAPATRTLELAHA